MELRSVRDAYSSNSRQYVDLFDGDWDADRADAAFIRRHLAVSNGAVLDLGCGPGHWTADLPRSRQPSWPGVSAGLDDRLEHAGQLCGRHPQLVLDDPRSPGRVGRRTRRVPSPPFPSGVLVLGFFDSDDEVAPFDHAVHTAYRWPCDLMARRVTAAGFVEVARLQRQFAERPDRKYAALAARAT